MAELDGAANAANEAAPHRATDPNVEPSPPTPAEDPEPLLKIITILQPLSPDARRRAVDAAMIFLGESAKPTTATSRKLESAANSENDSDYTTRARAWMRRHNVSTEALERVFHLTGTEFVIHEVPGKSKREQTINTYILTGLGSYLLNDGSGEFDDATARGFCERHGNFDSSNHAKYLKGKHVEFTGNKSKGYVLSNPGLKRGAELVKEIAGSNSD